MRRRNLRRQIGLFCGMYLFFSFIGQLFVLQMMFSFALFRQMGKLRTVLLRTKDPLTSIKSDKSVNCLCFENTKVPFSVEGQNTNSSKFVLTSMYLVHICNVQRVLFFCLLHFKVIQGDPNQHTLIQIAVPLKLYISDICMLGTPACA